MTPWLRHTFKIKKNQFSYSYIQFWLVSLSGGIKLTQTSIKNLWKYWRIKKNNSSYAFFLSNLISLLNSSQYQKSAKYNIAKGVSKNFCRVWDGVFCDNSLLLQALKYFRRKFYLRSCGVPGSVSDPRQITYFL